jgi:hypothetical protein
MALLLESLRERLRVSEELVVLSYFYKVRGDPF